MNGTDHGGRGLGPAEPGRIPGAISERLINDDFFGRVVVDANGFVLHVNEAACELIGRPAEDLIGVFMLDNVVESDHEIALESIAELQARVPREVEGIAMVFGLARADGTVTHVEVGAHNYLDDPELGIIILRLAPYDGSYHLRQFLASMIDLGRGNGGVDMRELVASADTRIQRAHSALGDGWDGSTFVEPTTRSLPPDLCGATPESAVVADGCAEPPWTTCLRSGQIEWVPTEALSPHLREQAEALGLLACWAAPVPKAAGVAEHGAALIVWREVEGNPKVGHRAAMGQLAGAAALAFERTQSQRALLDAATLDPLTKLPNRSQFFSALAGADGPVEAVLYLDLDGFKAVNDALGHLFGDRVLQAVAGIMAEAVKPGELLARLGGDEFAILLHHEATREELIDLAERLVASVSEPVQIGDVEVHLGLSVGIAERGTGLVGDALLDAADRMLYKVKHRRKGGWAGAWQE